MTKKQQMEKICGNCRYYKDIPQLPTAGCRLYTPVPLMAKDGPFLGYPPVVNWQEGCEDWMSKSSTSSKEAV